MHGSFDRVNAELEKFAANVPSTDVRYDAGAARNAAYSEFVALMLERLDDSYQRMGPAQLAVAEAEGPEQLQSAQVRLDSVVSESVSSSC